jgi:hypothetical protein
MRFGMRTDVEILEKSCRSGGRLIRRPVPVGAI